MNDFQVGKLVIVIVSILKWHDTLWRKSVYKTWHERGRQQAGTNAAGDFQIECVAKTIRPSISLLLHHHQQFKWILAFTALVATSTTSTERHFDNLICKMSTLQLNSNARWKFFANVVRWRRRSHVWWVGARVVGGEAKNMSISILIIKSEQGKNRFSRRDNEHDLEVELSLRFKTYPELCCFMIETLLSNLIVILGYIEETLRFILLLKLLYLSLPNH
jgi:hypothetical protein